MRNRISMSLRALATVFVAIGLMSAISLPAAAQSGTLCVAVGSGDASLLQLVDPSKGDGALTLADLETIVNSQPEGSQNRADLQSIYDNAVSQGVSEIRYDGTGACGDETPTETATATETSTATETATATETSVPDNGGDTGDNDNDNDTGDTGNNDTGNTGGNNNDTGNTGGNNNGGVNELPETGNGTTADQGVASSTFLFGAVSMLMLAGAFVLRRRHEA